MKRLYFLLFLIFSLISLSIAGNGIRRYSYFSHQLNESSPSVSRFNVKIQPAIFWATLGVEVEYLVSPKVTIALNVLGKLGQTDRKNDIRPLKQGDFLNNGFLAELIGRYFIQLSKKKLVLAPSGFYVQASVGYSKMLYFDGSTRPFTLHTRNRNIKEPYFYQPSLIIGGVGAGYQVELLPKKIIANLAVGAQTNFDTKGVFFCIYLSPSIGFMF